MRKIYIYFNKAIGFATSKFIKSLIILVSLMSVVSCVDDIDDYGEEIGDGYYYIPEHKDIVYDVVKVSCGISFKSVLRDVSSYKNLPNYMLIKQKLNYPNGFCYDLSFNDKFKDKACCNISEARTIYTHGLNNTYYFILDKETHKLFGPFIYSEFLEECENRNIRIF